MDVKQTSVKFTALKRALRDVDENVVRMVTESPREFRHALDTVLTAAEVEVVKALRICPAGDLDHYQAQLQILHEIKISFTGTGG